MSKNRTLESIDERLILVEEKVEKIRLIEKYDNVLRRWEISKTRIIYISITTYLITVAFMFAFEISDPITNAFIPAFGVFISIPSTPIVRRLWIKNFVKSEESDHESDVVKLQSEQN